MSFVVALYNILLADVALLRLAWYIRVWLADVSLAKEKLPGPLVYKLCLQREGKAIVVYCSFLIMLAQLGFARGPNRPI